MVPSLSWLSGKWVATHCLAASWSTDNPEKERGVVELALHYVFVFMWDFPSKECRAAVRNTCDGDGRAPQDVTGARYCGACNLVRLERIELCNFIAASCVFSERLRQLGRYRWRNRPLQGHTTRAAISLQRAFTIPSRSRVATVPSDSCKIGRAARIRGAVRERHPPRWISSSRRCRLVAVRREVTWRHGAKCRVAAAMTNSKDPALPILALRHVNQQVVQAWRDCMLDKNDGFICTAQQQSDDTLNFTLEWDTITGPSRLYLVWDLDRVEAQGELPREMGEGTKVKVLRLVNPDQGGTVVVNATGLRPEGTRFNIGCSYHVPKKRQQPSAVHCSESGVAWSTGSNKREPAFDWMCNGNEADKAFCHDGQAFATDDRSIAFSGPTYDGIATIGLCRLDINQEEPTAVCNDAPVGSFRYSVPLTGMFRFLSPRRTRCVAR